MSDLKSPKLINCSCCGGLLVGGKQKYHHLKQCKQMLEEGKDHLCCKLCGYRTTTLFHHLKLHKLTPEKYREKFHNAPLQLDNILQKRLDAVRSADRPIKPVQERKSAKQCEKCGEFYDSRYVSKHLTICIAKYPDKWKIGEDYVICPFCQKPFFSLLGHLFLHHSTVDQLSENTPTVARFIDGKRQKTNLVKYGTEFALGSPKIRQQIIETNKKKYGVESVFSLHEIQEKITKTNLNKYGVQYPMQNEEIFIKQQNSANNGPTSPELFLMRVLPKNVVFTGYGAKVIKVKEGVHKYGKLQFLLCPDFMVFPEASINLARVKSGMKRPMRGREFYSKFVIEVFGDYYHSEQIIGVPRSQHVEETRKAYASVGIDCLILWEADIQNRWLEIEPMVTAWLNQAISVMNNLTPIVPASFSLPPTDHVLASLDDAAYWRKLDDEKKQKVVEELMEMYGKIEFPWPSEDRATEDLQRFLDWTKANKTKPCRSGDFYCRHFVKSFAYAKPKSCRSKYDLWHDSKLLRKTIIWQLTNESGRHSALRFLNGLTHVNGFRNISNMPPSRVVCWLRKYASPKQSGVFFDPCAGWGARLLASYALGMKYRAIDANRVLVDELNQMAKILGADAKVVWGSADNLQTVKGLMQDEKADIVFTSPPYFDREDYSNDELQSSRLYPSLDDWYDKFMAGLAQNSLEILRPGGIILLNVFNGFDVERLREKVPFRIEDFAVSVEFAKSVGVERMLVFSNREPETGTEGTDFVTCQICKRRFARLAWHLKMVHQLAREDYQLKFGQEALLICSKDSARVAAENAAKEPVNYIPRIAYRRPDGSYVRKKDAWLKAWNGNPPDDSIVSANSINLDPWKGKIEGEDFVVCVRCGYRAANLTRHIKREHGGLEGYNGTPKSKKCQEALSKAALKSWDRRGRSEKKIDHEKLTHKAPGLTEVVLRDLYENQKMSDAKIGRWFGITGESVSYHRRKYGIATRQLRIS